MMKKYILETFNLSTQKYQQTTIIAKNVDNARCEFDSKNTNSNIVAISIYPNIYNK
jgi:hypothetical protein